MISYSAPALSLEGASMEYLDEMILTVLSYS